MSDEQLIQSWKDRKFHPLLIEYLADDNFHQDFEIALNSKEPTKLGEEKAFVWGMLKAGEILQDRQTIVKFLKEADYEEEEIYDI